MTNPLRTLTLKTLLTLHVNYQSGEMVMKVFGIIGAVLVIVGFISLSEPILSADNDTPSRQNRTLNDAEQYGGGGAILLGLGLVGLDIMRRQ
jgi:hypothetical protein